MVRILNALGHAGQHQSRAVVRCSRRTPLQLEGAQAGCVSQVMRALQTLHPVKPDASAGDALELMGRENMNQLPVVSDGHLEGEVTRSDLVHVWQVRHELTA